MTTLDKVAAVLADHNRELLAEAGRCLGFAERYDAADCPMDAAYNWYSAAAAIALVDGDVMESERCRVLAQMFIPLAAQFGMR